MAQELLIPFYLTGVTSQKQLSQAEKVYFGNRAIKRRYKVMGKVKRNSAKVVGESKIRLSAMQQIDTDEGRVVEYGGEGRTLTKVEFEAKVEECETRNADYNKLLEEADKFLNHVLQSERELQTMYTQVLKSAVAEFGEDADEIEMLGGTRISERKRPVRKSKDKS